MTEYKSVFDRENKNFDLILEEILKSFDFHITSHGNINMFFQFYEYSGRVDYVWMDKIRKTLIDLGIYDQQPSYLIEFALEGWVLEIRNNFGCSKKDELEYLEIWLNILMRWIETDHYLGVDFEENKKETLVELKNYIKNEVISNIIIFFKLNNLIVVKSKNCYKLISKNISLLSENINNEDIKNSFIDYYDAKNNNKWILLFY